MSWLNLNWGISSSFHNYFYGQNSTLEIPGVNIEYIQNLNPSKVEIKHYGLKAFDRFKIVFEIPDFWKRANTSDACLELIDTLFAQNPYDPEVREKCKEFVVILKNNLIYFNVQTLNDKWADDFGWWGLFGVNAYKFLIKIKDLLKEEDHDLPEKYLQLSCKCYELMINTGSDGDKTALPVPFGCRNSTIDFPAKGVKNTVTNALLFLLSIKLYSLKTQNHMNDADKFLITAYNQWIWFSAWFELKQFNYLKTCKGDDTVALVCERPLAFMQGSSYQDTSNPDWIPNGVWSGDQGLLIGALQGIMAVKDKLAACISQFDEKAFDDKIINVTKRLILGVHKGMIGKDGLIYEPPCVSSYVTDPNDYFGGRGILFRYMDLKWVKEFSLIDFKENVMKTTNALWTARDTETNQFQTEYASQQNHLEYANQYCADWDWSDESISWYIDHMPELKDPICQAIALDFITCTLKTF